MVSLKKIRNPNRDDWRPILVIVRASEAARFRAAADRAGMTVNQWARDRLGRIAPE